MAALYTVKIFKSWGARDPEKRWVNNYEIQSDGEDAASLQDTVDTIVDAERVIHSTNVQFLSALVSTIQEDSDPYNGNEFASYELAGTGSQTSAGAEANTFMDTRVCYVVKFVPRMGFQGRRFYRGCVAERDVYLAGDGKVALDPSSGLYSGQALFTAFQTALEPIVGPASGGDRMVLVKMPKEGDLVGATNFVERVAFGGITVVSRNHRYFDRQ